MPQFIVCALYKFTRLDHYMSLRNPLRKVMEDHQVRGTLLLASEGINGTIAGRREGIDAVVGWLTRQSGLEDIERKESRSDQPPFKRTKVKLKKEIVTMGVEGIDPNRVVGAYIEPEDWNQLLDDPEVLLVDTRNQYEVEVGHV